MHGNIYYKCFTIIFVFVLFVSVNVSAQDSLTIDRVKELQINETLVIGMKNSGCRVKSGDRYKITRTSDSLYVSKKYVDFYQTAYWDGQLVDDDVTRQKLIMSSGPSKVIKVDWARKEYISFVKKLDQIIISNNTEKPIIAGDSGILKMEIGQLIFEKKFKGWVAIEDFK